MNHEIVAKIKKLRMSKGFSQFDMADRLNITRATYQKLETGENYAWAKYLDELMSILETTPKDFFSDIGRRTINQNNYEGSTGYVVETLHQENKAIYEKLLQSKDEQIALLKSFLGKTNTE